MNEDGAEVAYGDAPVDYSTDVLRDEAVDFIQAHASAPVREEDALLLAKHCAVVVTAVGD